MRMQPIRRVCRAGCGWPLARYIAEVAGKLLTLRAHGQRDRPRLLGFGVAQRATSARHE